MTRKLSDSHYVNNQEKMSLLKEILQEHVRKVAAEVQKQVDSRVNFEDVNVEYKLSVLKPIHATWLVEMYNFFVSAHGRVSCHERMGENGNKGCSNWKRSITAC